MRGLWKAVTAGLALAFTAGTALASSHMDAPLITFDDAANTTDVYAFLSKDEQNKNYLTTAVSVFPFEEPGIGPNAYRFDDRVRYSIHVSLDGNVAKGKPDISYVYDFATTFRQNDTIRQSYLGALAPPAQGQFSANQNVMQVYRLIKIDHRSGARTLLGQGQASGLIVPPNNQGLLTRFYNQGDNGNATAKPGVSSTAALDPFTRSAIASLPLGYKSFAGQRDDAFYADIQSIFDLELSFGRAAGTVTPTKPFDSQGGFNVHTIALNIPIAELRGAKLAGVYATTERRDDVSLIDLLKFLSGKDQNSIWVDRDRAHWVQIGRQGNPLFVEGLVGLVDKDKYNQSPPFFDAQFGKYADNPELSRLAGVTPIIPGLIRSIFIPDLIKVDLTTGPAKLAGQGGFNRLSVFGGDTLKSTFQGPFKNGGFIPGGWPNGRRFGDDVVDIAAIALGLAGPGPDFSGVDVDRISGGEITPNQVFPYAATPQNGRNHPHHGAS